MIKKNIAESKWIVSLILIIVVAAVAYFFLLKNNPKKPSSKYLLYQDLKNRFSIKYPEAWEVRQNTQVFENGDAIAFGITGQTQKTQTELTDGAQVSISLPFKITTNLNSWIEKYFDDKAEISENILNNHTYKRVYTCSTAGCMTYLYTDIDNQIYGIAVFAQGANKMVYDNTVVYMIKSLRFNSGANRKITKEEAVARIKLRPEVVDYLKQIPSAKVEVNGEESDSYLIQVYEIKNNHTATFNWYKIDKTSGKITEN